MFWVFFDTSTKRAYYKDVHDLLALPPGATLRYDYGDAHISSAGLREAINHTKPALALAVYVQLLNYKKGDPPGDGPADLDGALWTATRVVSLRRVTARGDRRLFDLEVQQYPKQDGGELRTILTPLVAAGEVPFAKWVAVSEDDSALEQLTRGDMHANWSAIVDRLGTPPSQFAGDSFWRVDRILRGAERREIEPLIKSGPRQNISTGEVPVERAVFPVHELDELVLQLDMRSAEPASAPEGDLRRITLATPGDSPLAGLNGRSIEIRRHKVEHVDTKVGGTDFVSGTITDLQLSTSPPSGNYSSGPEIILHFSVSKSELRSKGAIFLWLVSAVLVVIGGLVFKDDAGLGIVLIAGASICGLVGQYLWSGRVLLFGGRR